MQSLSRYLARIDDRHLRMTAVGVPDFLCAVGEGQVPRWTGRSLRKSPLTAMGRVREVRRRKQLTFERPSASVASTMIAPSLKRFCCRAPAIGYVRRSSRWTTRRSARTVCSPPPRWYWHWPSPAGWQGKKRLRRKSRRALNSRVDPFFGCSGVDAWNC